MSLKNSIQKNLMDKYVSLEEEISKIEEDLDFLSNIKYMGLEYIVYSWRNGDGLDICRHRGLLRHAIEKANKNKKEVCYSVEVVLKKSRYVIPKKFWEKYLDA